MKTTIKQLGLVLALGVNLGLEQGEG